MSSTEMANDGNRDTCSFCVEQNETGGASVGADTDGIIAFNNQIEANFKIDQVVLLDYKRLEEFMQEMAKLKSEKFELLRQNVVWQYFHYFSLFSLSLFYD